MPSCGSAPDKPKLVLGLTSGAKKKKIERETPGLGLV